MKMNLIRAKYTTLSGGAFNHYTFINRETISDVEEIATLYPNVFQRTINGVFGNADEREIKFSSQMGGDVLRKTGKIQEGDIYITDMGSILKMVKGSRGVLFIIYIEPNKSTSGITALKRSMGLMARKWQLLGQTHEYLLFMNWLDENPLEVKE